jgi:hypothetical protein
MSIFIIWPIDEDSTFRPAYYAQTGEAIQDSPPHNSGRDHFIAGSSRVSLADCALLQAAFPSLVFGENPVDLGWIDAGEDDIL